MMASVSEYEEPPWIELTEPKQFSRLLYTHPVCFLTTTSNGGKRNVMTISWLTATNNEGAFMCSMNIRRHTATILQSGVFDFVLSVPVQGMETLVRDVGAISGKWGSKFPADHVGQELPKELQGQHLDKQMGKNKRKRLMSAAGVPGLEAVPFGSQTPALSTGETSAFGTKAFAIRGTVAHMTCSSYKLIESVIDSDHLLILATITAAHVHPSYWDATKNRFRPERDAPPYLTFFGSQEFGYIVNEDSGNE